MSYKISFLLISILFLSSLATLAQPTMEFKQAKIEIGEISEYGGKVSREFSFRNSGNSPLLILDATTSCSCTKVTYPKSPIMAGKDGVITVTFDPKKQVGTIYKAINIYCNTPSKRHIITLSGSVK